MEKLKVSFVSQFNEDACGAACTEMILSYFGIQSTQEEIFEKIKERDPADINRFRISGESIIEELVSRGLFAQGIHEDFSNQASLDRMVNFLKRGFPIIVIQQHDYKVKNALGHYRVITKIDANHVYFHDPDTKGGGGKDLKWSRDKFMRHWQPTGPNVLGGKGLYVANEEIRLR